MKTSREETKKKNAIFFMSSYARAYTKGDGSIRGVILSGYRQSGDGGNRVYTNIWVKGDKVAISKNKDGSFTLRLNLLEIERKIDEEEGNQKWQ